MKKKITIAAAILVLCFAFVSCGKSMADSPYLGTWKATSASYSGITMAVESILGGEMVFELKDTGKCELTIADESHSGSWTETEDGFNVEDEFDFIVDGDTATLDYEDIIITLERQ